MSINDGTATGQVLLNECEQESHEVDDQKLRVSDDYRNAFILQATTMGRARCPRFLL